MIEAARSFFELWELFRTPTLAATLAGAVLGMMGVYVVLRNMVFLSAALSQTAGLGVAIGFFLRVHFEDHSWMTEPTVWATVFTLAAVFFLTRRSGASADARLGTVFLLSWAGTLALGTRIVAEMHDIETLLNGSAVAVLDRDLVALAAWLVPMAVVHIWWWRGFGAVTQDRDDAQVRGMPAALVETVLMVTVALGVSLVTRVLGALPAFAFSVLPGVAALRIAPNLAVALGLGLVLGGASGAIGYFTAYAADLPVGASQALTAAAFAGVAAVLGMAIDRRARPSRVAEDR